MIAAVLFWTVCLLTVAGAAVCVFARNLFRAALGLGGCLLGVAGLYLFLQAEYLAAIQLVVYVGGVLVLAVFGVMASRDILGETQRPRPLAWIAGCVAGGATLAALVKTVINTCSAAPGLNLTRTPAATTSSTAALGDLLAGPWLMPLLVVAVLLLVVLVGALALVRHDEETT